MVWWKHWAYKALGLLRLARSWARGLHGTKQS